MTERTEVLTCYVFAWGTSFPGRMRRSQLADQITAVREKEKSSKECHNVWLSDEERTFLDATTVDCGPLKASKVSYMAQWDEYDIKVSEETKHVTKHDLFLNDTDGDSHTPIVFNIREKELVNKRNGNLNVYNKFLTPLSMALMMSNIVVAKADSESCASANEMHIPSSFELFIDDYFWHLIASAIMLFFVTSVLIWECIFKCRLCRSTSKIPPMVEYPRKSAVCGCCGKVKMNTTWRECRERSCIRLGRASPRLNSRPISIQFQCEQKSHASALVQFHICYIFVRCNW